MIETFAALSEPNRLRIVELLHDGPQAVGVIADTLGLNQPQVSKHLNILKKAHLVEVEARAQQRLYRLDGQGLQLIDQWLDRYRRIWTDRLDQLDEVIAHMQKQEK